MSSQPQVASFVVRCSGFSDAEQPSPIWRITVSHVQGEEEITVTCFEEVCKYMKEKLSG
ncbi:hypothetical protein HF078_11350 [Bacillus sp. RO2]|uniref:hypothetical protein n=1 Tax=Bacillus sp. RO2 TaxID=2723913 RepID=UPI00145FC03F|nr:hypothetical protein [Bacillus sp. RO2]NMH73674.1 hypothetical protein [Bacillus sp. RO2]